MIAMDQMHTLCISNNIIKTNSIFHDDWNLDQIILFFSSDNTLKENETQASVFIMNRMLVLFFWDMYEISMRK
jgi:hypothetical protein